MLNAHPRRLQATRSVRTRELLNKFSGRLFEYTIVGSRHHKCAMIADGRSAKQLPVLFYNADRRFLPGRRLQQRFALLLAQ